MASSTTPAISSNQALFNAVDALCQLAGLTRPNINRDSANALQAMGSAAIVALQAAGVPTSGIIAALAARVTAVELAVIDAMAAAVGAQASADAAAAAAAAAQADATQALENVTLEAENKDVTTISPGMAVAAHPSGTGVILARNTAFSTACFGLSETSAAPTFIDVVRVSNILTLPDWTAATGAPALAPLGVYFLGVAPGTLTLVAPVAVGSIAQIVGLALSPTTMRLLINPPVQL